MYEHPYAHTPKNVHTYTLTLHTHASAFTHTHTHTFTTPTHVHTGGAVLNTKGGKKGGKGGASVPTAAEKETVRTAVAVLDTDAKEQDRLGDEIESVIAQVSRGTNYDKLGA
jgi:hypothetical protein